MWKAEPPEGGPTIAQGEGSSVLGEGSSGRLEPPISSPEYAPVAVAMGEVLGLRWLVDAYIARNPLERALTDPSGGPAKRIRLTIGGEPVEPNPCPDVLAGRPGPPGKVLETAGGSASDHHPGRSCGRLPLESRDHPIPHTPSSTHPSAGTEDEGPLDGVTESGVPSGGGSGFVGERSLLAGAIKSVFPLVGGKGVSPVRACVTPV